MRLTAIALLAFSLHVGARAVSQTVTYSGKDVSLETVFNVIEKQTGYVVFYDYRQISGARTVTLDVKNEPLKDFLEKCFHGQPFGFSMEDKTILITHRALVTLAPAPVPPPPPAEGPPVIRVRVIDSTGAPLEGANIQARVAKVMIQTDFRGMAILNGVTKGDVLVVSFVGYKTRAVPVTDDGFVNVILQAGDNSLDEMQIVAYGTVSRRLNTGDVSTVKGSDIEKQPVSDIFQALEGRIPGLLIQQQGGMPGSATYGFQLRGTNTLPGNSANPTPLIVIDGVPYNSTDLAGSTILNGLINPKDVASVDVLKDADATSIYGSRGANGVILITTRSGKPGPTAVTASVTSGANGYTGKIDLMNLPQYLEMRKEAFTNDGITPNASNAPDLTTWSQTNQTDWVKTWVRQPSTYTTINVGASGGSGNTVFRVNLGYNNSTPPLPGDWGSKKGTLSTDLSNTSANGKFNFDLRSSLALGQMHTPLVDPTSEIYLPPNLPSFFNPDGSFNWSAGFGNPYAQLKQISTTNSKYLQSGLTLNYLPVTGLTLTGLVSYSYNINNNEVLIPLASENPAWGYTSGSATLNYSNGTVLEIDPSASYRHRLFTGLLTVQAGATYTHTVSQSNAFTATGFINDLTLQDVGSAASVTSGAPSYVKDLYGGVFGRLNYNLGDEYLLQVNVRRDGSSSFGPDRRFGTFPSVAPAWIFTKESFVRRALPFLSFGKLGVSYGTAGMNGPAYSYLDLYNITTFAPYQGAATLSPASLYNPGLAWGSIRKLNASLNLAFLHDRLSVGGSWYHNRSSNQIEGDPLPSMTGFGGININWPALVQNTGVELTLSSVDVRTAKFSWATTFNVSIPRNKLVSYPDLASSTFINLEIGKPVTGVKTLNYAGVDPTTGVYQFYNKSGKTTLNPIYPDDYTAFVDHTPRFFGGFDNQFRYGNFSLDVFFQFKKQIGSYPFGGGTQNPPGFMINEPASLLADRWQKPGDKTSVEQFTETYGTAWNQWFEATSSNGAYVNASYIRLQNLTFGYSFERRWMQTLRIRSAGVSLGAQNLLTISKYPGPDPENPGSDALPPMRTVTGSLNIAF